jgi:hypothetical protein
MSGHPELPLALRFDLVCVIDTSALIMIKRLVSIDDQWDLLQRMGTLVQSGHLTFPRQVAKELAYGQYPDAPGAWIGNAKQHVCHPQPSEETLLRVLSVADQLVDAEATSNREVADPYVAAMACEIRDRNPGCRSVVATDDRIDRLPVKLSLVTACERLKIECWTPDQFIAWATGKPENPV